MKYIRRLILRAIQELDELYDIGDGLDGQWIYFTIEQQEEKIDEFLKWFDKLPWSDCSE